MPFQVPPDLQHLVDHKLLPQRREEYATACNRLQAAEAAVPAARNVMETRQREQSKLAERSGRGEPIPAPAVLDARRAVDEAAAMLAHAEAAIAGAKIAWQEASASITAGDRDAHEAVLAPLIRRRLSANRRLDAAQAELQAAREEWQRNHVAT